MRNDKRRSFNLAASIEEDMHLTEDLTDEIEIFDNQVEVFETDDEDVPIGSMRWWMDFAIFLLIVAVHVAMVAFTLSGLCDLALEWAEKFTQIYGEYFQ